jgi:N-methylhydantoinase B
MPDEITLEVHRHRLEGIAEEMGTVLQRAAFSPNIKERRDFSCALTDAKGRLVTQAAHIPVHLGAIPIIMETVRETNTPEKGEGILLNDPYAGGTHLPDLTFLMPWYGDGTLLGYVINRAHHTDIGGQKAGSMAVGEHIDEEGFRTGPRTIVRNGELDRSSIEDLLEMTREPDRRITDLEAQVAAARRGLDRLTDWRESLDESPGEIFQGLINYTGEYTANLFKSMPEGQYHGKDLIDSDGRGTNDVKIEATVSVEEDRLTVDFRDSADQVKGNINCPRAVTHSATYYVFQCLLADHVPINQGVLDRVEVRTRSGSLLDAEYPAAVAGGNVETSQRIVDVLLSSLADVFPDQIPAHGQGTMNNLTLGWETEEGTRTYYETLGGGAGGGPDHPGLSARQVHMTNTLNTPIEEFERQLPVLVEYLRIREDSGGDGEQSGGDGLIKQWRALQKLDVSFLTERRIHSPKGLRGAGNGEAGKNIKRVDDTKETLPAKTSLTLSQGEALRFETPGGGGWNPADINDD